MHAHLLLDARALALLHALDGIVLDGLLLAALVHLGVLAGPELLVYAAQGGIQHSTAEAWGAMGRRGRPDGLGDRVVQPSALIVVHAGRPGDRGPPRAMSRGVTSWRDPQQGRRCYPAHEVQDPEIDQQYANHAAFEFAGIVIVAVLFNCSCAGFHGCRTLRKTP